jgi:hypothetical protein
MWNMNLTQEWKRGINEEYREVFVVSVIASSFYVLSTINHVFMILLLVY